MAIGKQIRHYRTKLGWKLRQLSEECDVDVGTISALELRDSNKSDFFPAIAKALGLTVEQLADESRDYEPKPPSRVAKTTYAVSDGKSSSASFPLTESVPRYTADPAIDQWSAAAAAIMQELDIGQRQAMVAKMREYRQFLGPPSASPPNQGDAFDYAI